MLAENRNYEDLTRVLSFLRELDLRTDKRYTRDAGAIYNNVNALLQKIKSEVQYRQKLQSYKTQGFSVDGYINKAYTNYESMVTELNQVIQNIENLMAIQKKYEAIISKVPNALRQPFQTLLKQPEKYLEAVSMWNQIQVTAGLK